MLWERTEEPWSEGTVQVGRRSRQVGADRRNRRGKSVHDPGLGDEGTVFKEREASTWSSGAPQG